MLHRLDEIERRLKFEVSTFILDINFITSVEDHFKKKLKFNDVFMKEESLVYILKFLKNENQEAYNWLQEIKQKIKSLKRRYSTTHRIEIAYKTKYRCNMCKLLLPPTFEIDHIKELWEGGRDEYDNLQALCPNCHALKTRANVLKKNNIFRREFTKRAREYEENAFENFKHTKKSKYF